MQNTAVVAILLLIAFWRSVRVFMVLRAGRFSLLGRYNYTFESKPVWYVLTIGTQVVFILILLLFAAAELTGKTS
jgi:hypothetical protein